MIIEVKNTSMVGTSSDNVINVENVKLQQENEILKSKIDKTFQLLQLLHYKFDDNDAIHYEIEDIQKMLKE